MRSQFQYRDAIYGGITGYPLDRLYEEVAFLAYYLHWDHETLMELEHKERQKWCQEVSQLNKKIGGTEGKNIFDV